MCVNIFSSHQKNNINAIVKNTRKIIMSIVNAQCLAKIPEYKKKSTIKRVT